VHARLRIEKFGVFLRELVFCFFFVVFVVEKAGDRDQGAGSVKILRPASCILYHAACFALRGLRGKKTGARVEGAGCRGKTYPKSLQRFGAFGF